MQGSIGQCQRIQNGFWKENTIEWEWQPNIRFELDHSIIDSVRVECGIEWVASVSRWKGQIVFDVEG